jgi:hypothetical protein
LNSHEPQTQCGALPLSYNPRNHLSFIEYFLSVIFDKDSLKLAETAGFEPAREFLPDCLANSYGYRFITFPRKNFGATNFEMTCFTELNLLVANCRNRNGDLLTFSSQTLLPM